MIYTAQVALIFLFYFIYNPHIVNLLLYFSLQIDIKLLLFIVLKEYL